MLNIFTHTIPPLITNGSQNYFLLKRHKKTLELLARTRVYSDIV